MGFSVIDIQTHRQTDGKPPIRVLMYRRNPKNAKKRNQQTDRQTDGKPPIRGLMYRRNPKNAKKRNQQTHRQTDRQTDGKPPIRVLMYTKKKKTKNEVDVHTRGGECWLCATAFTAWSGEIRSNFSVIDIQTDRQTDIRKTSN